ncbi:MAG TPA: FAD-dependent oxidoreductase [Terriglobales bacterium]|nr:FAD-dependent oxidoreductase [Terriglobales bacterium]
MTCLILGGGVAGLTAARAVRERDGACQMVMLTAEPRAPYIRPLLSKAAFGGLNPARISLDTAGLNLELHTDCKVLRIDTSCRRVFSTAGDFGYDACVYAMGAHSFMPDFPGSQQGHVLRCTEDFFAIKRALPRSFTAAIVGGGVIGVEMAWLLRERGLSVRILELAPRLMPRQLDDEASALVCRLLESRGIEVETGVSLKEAPSADILVVSCGIRPNDEIAKAAGITLAIDEHMATDIPGVYACGDCVGAGLYTVAEEQGRVAGANAAAFAQGLEGTDVCRPVCRDLLLHLGGPGVFATGRITQDAKTQAVGKSPLFRVNPGWQGDTFRRTFYDGGKPVGGVIVGDLSAAAQLRRDLACG